MYWRCNSYSEDHGHRWDAERFILFNPDSAQTHQLNPLATDILSLLKDQPLDFTELNKRLISLYEDLEFDSEAAAYIQETLELLDGIGLIEPESM